LFNYTSARVRAKVLRNVLPSCTFLNRDVSVSGSADRLLARNDLACVWL